MLVNKLTELNSGGKAKCLLGQLISTMDKETFDAFTSVMKNPLVSAEQICKILNEEGLSTGVSHLRQKRRTCFSDNVERCDCIKAVSGGK